MDFLKKLNIQSLIILDRFINFARDKKNKRLALITGAVLITGGVATTIVKSKSNEENFLYLKEANFDSSFSMYTDDGYFVNINNDEELYVVTDSKKTANNELYYVNLINNEGFIQAGYLKGEYINDKIIYDKIPVDDCLIDSSEIDVVTPNVGCWIRKEKTLDRDTEDAKLLEKGTYVIASSLYSTSCDNDYYWKNAVYVNTDDLTFYSGYMAEGYLMNSDYDKAKGIKFKNTVEVGLKIRNDAIISEDNVAHMLEYDEEVILVPNLPSVTVDNKDYFYVAYKDNDGKINFGYCAATVYHENGYIENYLVECDNSYIDGNELKHTDDNDRYRDTNNKIVFKKVDVSNSDVNYLNLRESPGLESDVILKIENGDVVYTYTSEMDNIQKKDSYNWIKVYLLDGTYGYVADKYIKDYVLKRNRQNTINTNENNQSFQTGNYNSEAYKFDFGHEGNIEGYFGVDVNTYSINDSSLFENLITENNTYYDSYPYNMQLDKKLDFVIFKLGATGWGSPFKFVGLNSNEIKNANELINKCEENEVPYGLYYYSQATTIEEADAEAENICSFLKLYNIYTKNSNLLPLYIDIECYGYANGMTCDTRVLTNAKYNGKTYQTNTLNYLMNKVREDSGLEVCLYTDYNTLSTTINFTELDELNKSNCWIVDVSETHSNNLSGSQSEVFDYCSMRQSEVDMAYFYDSNGYKIDNIYSVSYDKVPIDYDIMTADYYQEHVKTKKKTVMD